MMNERYVASVIAYLIGSLSDIWIFGVIKRLTKGKLLWLRATGSTVISQVIKTTPKKSQKSKVMYFQILDSFVVSYIAFSLGKSLNGQPPASIDEVFNIAATGYGLKFFLAASLTPLLYFLKTLMTDKFGLQPIPAFPGETEEDLRS